MPFSKKDINKMFKKILCVIPLFLSTSFAQKIPTEWKSDLLPFRSTQQQEALNYSAIKTSLSINNCYLEPLKTIKNDNEFFVVWSGNECGGGNGTGVIDIAGISDGFIKNSFFDLPNFINTRFLTDIQVISEDEYVITSYEFDENDTNNHSPSIQVKNRIIRDKSSNATPSKWKIEKISSKKTSDNDDFIGNIQQFDNENELITSYEIYNAASNLSKFDSSITSIESVLKMEGTPFLIIAKKNDGYKIMSFDTDSSELNKDYFNYKYNDLKQLESFKIINPEYFEFTIQDEEDYNTVITYGISLNENSKWTTTELKREKTVHDIY